MKPPTSTFIIQTGGIYSSEQVCLALRISSGTLRGWVKSGLPYTQPFTRSLYFLGDDLIAFLEKFKTVRKEQP